MDEVDSDAVDCCREVGKRVQVLLPRLPLELGEPVVDELSQVADLGAGRPGRDR